MVDEKTKKCPDEWRKEIQEQQKSGMSVVNWCKINGVNRSSFYKHLKFVQEEQKKENASPDTKSDCIDLSFASIELSEKRTTQATGISIELANANIQIAPDANKEHIKIVLQELRYA